MARQRYEQHIQDYLAYCYEQRTAARVTELADLLDVAHPILSRAISRLFAKPPHHLLRERQLEEACRLLRVTDLSVQDVALAAAFGTDQTFYRSFRAAFGMTPGEYRKKMTGHDSMLTSASGAA